MSFRHPVLIWLVAFLGYACLGTAWALAIPVNGHTDERAHIIRTYAVATGQISGRKPFRGKAFAGSEFAVPASLLAFQ